MRVAPKSFIRSTSILPTDVLLDYLSLEYHETLMSLSGFYAEESKREAMEKHKGKYVLVVEGSVSPKDKGVYCTVAGKSSVDTGGASSHHLWWKEPPSQLCGGGYAFAH